MGGANGGPQGDMVSALAGPCWDEDQERLALVRATVAEAVQVQHGLQPLAGIIARAAWICWSVLAGGGTLLVFGNGGSAAEGQHFAAELSGRFARERRGLPAVALTTDTSALTAIGNDYGFHHVFGRQIDALGRAGDAALGITTSGRSPNVVEGLRVARAKGMATIALTGVSSPELEAVSDLVIAVPGPSTARVQEGQLTALHIICDLVEREVVKA